MTQRDRPLGVADFWRAGRIKTSSEAFAKARDQLQSGLQLLDEAPRIALDGRTRNMPKRKAKRGPRHTPPDENQYDRDLRMLIGVWESTCESAREEFLQQIERI